jgi:hypothetical protein
MSRLFTSKLLLSALILGTVATLSAAPLCTSVTTLDTYVGTSCAIGNLVFTFPGAGAYTGTGTASNVQVQTFGSGAVGDPTGFIFSYVGTPANGWTASGGLTDINLGFSVALGPANVGFDPAGFAITTGNLSIDDTITSPAVLNRTLAAETISGAGQIQLNVTSTGVTSGSLGLSGSTYTVTKDVLVKDLAGGSNTVNSITETFVYSSVPEPGAVVLTAAGLGLVFFIRRKKAGLRVLGGLAIVLALCSGSAHASTLCSSIGGVTPHIQDFISAGSCSIGDILFTFSGATYNVSNTSIDYADTAATAAMYVDTANGGIGFHFVPVVDVSGFSADQSTTVTLSITGQLLSSDVLSFYSSYAGTRFGTTSTLTGSSELKVGGSDPATTPGGNDPLPNFIAVGSGTGIFTTPLTSGTTFTFTNTYTLNAPHSDITNDVHISDTVMQVFEPSGVPEPVTAALTGSALFACAVVIRRRKAKK